MSEHVQITENQILPRQELVGQAMAATRRLLNGDPDVILMHKDQASAMFRERLQSREARAMFAGFLFGSVAELALRGVLAIVPRDTQTAKGLLCAGRN